MTRLAILGLSVAALAGPLRLAAQDPPAERVLRGLIVDCRVRFYLDKDSRAVAPD